MREAVTLEAPNDMDLAEIEYADDGSVLNNDNKRKAPIEVRMKSGKV